MHIIDIIIVITYLGLCILIGLYKSKSIKTLKEYALGKGYFPDIIIITTLFATDIGAGSVMGNMGKVYTLGLFFIVTRLASPLFWLIMAKIYGQNIDQFLGLMSISDIMEKLYGKVGRWVTNIASIFVSIGFVAMQAAAIGHLANYFFGVGYNQSVLICTLIVALYSSFGGIRAVALTDVFQFIVIMIAIPIACSFAYHDVGGYNGIINGLPQDMLKLELNTENIWLFLSLIFYSLLRVNGGPYIQRFLINKNAKQLLKCLKVIAFLYLPFTLIICLIGLIIRVKAPNIDPDEAFIYFISNYVSVGIKGLIIAGLLAVIMSTADSWLNTTSVLFTHDIIGKIIPLNDKQALLMARTFTLLLSMLAIVLAMYKKALIEIEWLACSFYDPLVIVPLTAGFLSFRTNSKSFIVAITIATLSTSISGYIVEDLSTISLMCGIIGSAVGLFGMHYWQVHQGTLNINTQPTKFTNEKTKVYSEIDRGELKKDNYSMHIFEDEEKQVITIDDQLQTRSFIMDIEKSKKEGIEKGLIEVAGNLLLQGFDTKTIEHVTGISRPDLMKLQKENK